MDKQIICSSLNFQPKNSNSERSTVICSKELKFLILKLWLKSGSASNINVLSFFLMSKIQEPPKFFTLYKYVESDLKSDIQVEWWVIFLMVLVVSTLPWLFHFFLHIILLLERKSVTDRSNENGTLTNKYYWNECTLNRDNMP